MMTKPNRVPRAFNVAVLTSLAALAACAAPPSTGPNTAVSPAAGPAWPQLGPVIATVTVDCMIEIDGYPSHCRVVHSTGDQQYVNKTLAWLNGEKKPRYRPADEGAAPRREEHQWIVSFSSPGAAPGS